MITIAATQRLKLTLLDHEHEFTRGATQASRRTWLTQPKRLEIAAGLTADYMSRPPAETGSKHAMKAESPQKEATIQAEDAEEQNDG
jgi:hypothetical protein